MLFHLKSEVIGVLIALTGAACGLLFDIPMLLAITLMAGLFMVRPRASVRFLAITDASIFTIGMWAAYWRQPKPDGRFYQVIHKLGYAAATRIDKVMSLPPEQQLVWAGLVLVTGLIGAYGVKLIVSKRLSAKMASEIRLTP